MGEKMDEFKKGLNVEAARSSVPEMSTYEEPYYRSGPTFLSMFPRYFLILLVLAVHMLFYFMEGDAYDAEGKTGGLVFLLNLLDFLADTGSIGFFGILILLTWINRFVNFSTSGSLYTVSLLLISVTPGLFVLEDIFTGDGLVADLIGTQDSGFLPDWSKSFYLIFGLGYTGVMFLLTVMYQRAFTYVITDKQVYLKKEFLKFVDANSHAISLTKIENLKVERSLIGRMLGYGSLHVITASGMGLRQESMSIGGGATTEVTDAATNQSSNFLVRMLRFMFIVVRLQRTRTTVDLDPEDCFYGIRNPMDVYALVNELRTRPGAPEDGEISSGENSQDSADNSEI
jgi:hypothetical protein